MAELPGGPYVTQLTSDIQEHWAALPYALEEIFVFTQAHEPDRDATQLCEVVRASWVLNDGSCAVFIVHADEKTFLPIFGHMLLTVETDVRGSFVHVWQAHISHEHASDMRSAWMADALERAKAWSIDRDIHRLCMVTSRKPAPFVRRYGFKIARTTLEMEV